MTEQQSHPLFTRPQVFWGYSLKPSAGVIGGTIPGSEAQRLLTEKLTDPKWRLLEETDVNLLYGYGRTQQRLTIEAV